MLKYLVIILLILNIILFGWIAGLFGSEANRQALFDKRMSYQLHPEAIRVVPEQTAQIIASRVQAGNQAPTSSTHAAPSATLCLETGPLNASQSAQLQRIVGNMLPPNTWEIDTAKDVISWAVYIPAESNEYANTRKIELNRMQIDADIVRGKPEYEPGLTLGLFNSQTNAQGLLQSIQNKGVTDARIQPWTYLPLGQLLRINQTTQTYKDLLDELISQTDIPALVPCQP